MRRRFMSNSLFDINNYLTIVALEDGLTAKLSTNACEYCVDGDGNWKTLTAATNTKAINKGQTLSFRGNLTPNSINGIGTFTISKSCNLEGNCMSMLFRNDAANNFSLSGKDYAFCKLFYDCTTIKGVSSGFLSTTTLANSCYQSMFYGCTSLTTAPELPATTLVSNCYYKMFYGTNILPNCSNIDFSSVFVVSSGGLKGLFSGTKVTDSDLERILPKNSNGKYCLPATTLATNCYGDMFEGCTSLTTAPELPATTLTYACYDSMFRGCTSLTTAPELPATTLVNSCYQSMFYGCTSLTTAPELPATTLVSNCYYKMFYGCTSLTTAPELPATTLVSWCYGYMFYGCSKLNYIKAMFTTTPSTLYTSNWVQGVASSGKFIKNKNATWNVTGANGIPSGWSIQSAAQ